MEWNPILVRETRARFRHWGAFALLFGYALLLVLAIGWRYADAASQYAALKNPLFRLSALGHELFLSFLWMQALAWVLIAPAVTSASIAREREDGLLEALLLAPLSPLKILVGKLLSALSFIALILLVSLPVQAVCFLMGGVSPAEYRAAFALHASTAFFGACLGLACSAWSKRANIALRSAYVLLTLWLVGSGVAMGAVLSGWKVKWWELLFNQFTAWTNPIVAAFAIADPDSLSAAAPSSGIFADAPWAISIVFQLLMSLALLALSTLALRRPFEARDETRLKNWQKPVDFSTSPLEKSTAPAPNTSIPKPRTDSIEIPVAAQLKFNNPVMQREARGKFRLKAPPLWILVFEGLLALVVGYYYMMVLWAALFNKHDRETIWWVISFIGLFVIAVAAAVMGASTFTREREGQTWNALRLSLLKPSEIISAKLGAILLAFAVYSIPFWPLLLPCVRPALEVRDTPGDNGGVSIWQALATLAVLGATAVCYATWGMWWSWRMKRTIAAIGWSLGSLFFILVFVPAFGAAWLLRGENWFLIYHPFVALGMVTDREALFGIACALVLLLIAGGLLARVRHEMTHSDL